MRNITDRVVLLINQNRNQEAKKLLEEHLEQNPERDDLKYYYAQTLLRMGENDKAREITDVLMLENPDSTSVLELSIDIDVKDDLLEKAESKAKIYIDMAPGSATAFLTMAQVKLAQRNYDKAQLFADQCLEIDPENLQALNVKIMIQRVLGDTSNDSIETALELEPENPSTVANHGMMLLAMGKTDKALERLEYALSLDPNNQIARYGMLEAMKSKFWPYKMLFKFGLFTAKLTEKGSWGLIIGAYVVYQFILRAARNNPGLEPYLMPVAYVMLTMFLMTWILDPLMNLCLFGNKYGRLLLEEDDKKMAKLCGISLLGVVVSLLLYFFVWEEAAYFAFIFGVSLIPFGTFLKPTLAKNQKKTTYFTIGLVVFGLLAMITRIPLFLGGYVLGVFAYQFYINSVMISENARVID